ESSSFLHCDMARALFFSNSLELHALFRKRISKMSAPLVVSIPHRLGREEARRRLKNGLTRAGAGHVDVEDDHVRVEVTLPWLLQRFAEAAQATIKNRGRLLLTKRD